ncbi:MAG: metal-dependent transcriptional regulator [Eubacteriales bacterium]|nr:metal-dependent transcriptional regulator [Eubacteriales bacterium]
MRSNESSEDYLEAILVLSHCKPVVRSVDIAEEMGYKKSSISVAMKNLREKGKITVTPEGYIYLTEEGRRIAEMIYERHTFFSQWLTDLGVPEKTAIEDACRIEHAISSRSFDAIRSSIVLSDPSAVERPLYTIRKKESADE